MSTSTPQNDAKTVANRTIVQAAVLAVVVLMSIVAWLAFDFILLLFASILFGVLIHGVSRWLCSKTALSYKLSMAVFFVLLLLGLIAGLLSFIPNIGPVLAVIPALLLASLEGGRTVLYVAALYLFIQALESYVFTPWMQQRIVSVPPALTIAVQLLFGLLAGTLGLLLATPLAAVGMVLVRMLYVEDLLGDRPQATDGPSA